MFLLSLKRAFRYQKNHRYFASLQIFSLCIGFFYLFFINAYVLEGRAPEADQERICQLSENTKIGSDPAPSSFASKLETQSEVLFAVIEKEIISILSGAPKRQRESQK